MWNIDNGSKTTDVGLGYNPRHYHELTLSDTDNKLTDTSQTTMTTTTTTMMAMTRLACVKSDASL